MASSWKKLSEQGNKKAEKKGRKPYILNDLPDDPDNEKPMVINYPDGEKQLEYEAAKNTREQLQILLGARNFRRLMACLKGEVGETAELLIEEMHEHWDVDEDIKSVPGGKGE